MDRLWVGLLVLVPLLPKVAIANLGGVPFLLDDCALACALAVAIGGLVARAAVNGDLRFSISRLVPIFLLLLYKSADLGVLSIVHSWTDRFGIGKGVLVAEGVLVLAKTLAFFLVYLLLFTFLRDRESLRTLLRYQVWCIAVVVGFGLFQFFVLGHQVLTSTFRNIHHLAENPVAWNIKDPWLDPSAAGHEQLGAYMLLSLGLLGGLLLCKWPLVRAQRFLLILLWVGCLFNLVFSSSRGSWVGGTGVLAMLSWFALTKGRARVLILVAFLIVGSSYLLKWGWGEDVFGYLSHRIAGLAGFSQGEVRDDSGQHRLRLLSGLWKIVVANPVLGMGPGGAGRIAEGQFIRELVEGGAVGLALFLALMVQCGRLALRLYQKALDPLARGVGMGFICCLAGLAGQAFFTELLVLTKVSVPFWILAALVHRLGALPSQPVETR